MKFLNILTDQAEKSDCSTFSHGAVCIIGGKVVSYGFNTKSQSHAFKVAWYEQQDC